MRTGIVLEPEEARRLSIGGRIEVTLEGAGTFLIIGPTKRMAQMQLTRWGRKTPRTPEERRAYQRKWAANKRAHSQEVEKRTLSRAGPASLLSTSQVAARLSMTRENVHHATRVKALRLAKVVKDPTTGTDAHFYRWADVQRWREKIGKPISGR